MKPDLIVIGHLMREKIIFPDHIIGPMVGGATAYFSVVASCLGSKVGIVSKIGRDISDNLLDPIYKAGVDIKGIRIEGVKSRTSELYYDTNGSKKMRYPYKGKPIIFEDIPINYLQADMIYISPQEWEFSLKEIEKLSSFKGKMAVELGGYGGAHCSHHLSIDKNCSFLKRLLPYFHIAKLSIEDCKYLFKEKNEIKIAQNLIEWGVEISIITLSSKGAIIATSSDVFKIPSFTQSQLDCTGAGDAFAAGFMVSYRRKNKDVKKAGLFASATAAVMIERTGGMNFNRMPNLLEVEERLNNRLEQ